jgi:hypothetical protein
MITHHWMATIGLAFYIVLYCCMYEYVRTCFEPQSTYIYKEQSSVRRLPNYWPPTHSPPSELLSFPPHQRRGVHTCRRRRAVRGWGVNILEDARDWIGLLQYNPSTHWTFANRRTRKMCKEGDKTPTLFHQISIRSLHLHKRIIFETSSLCLKGQK